jgi:hypothetical protein
MGNIPVYRHAFGLLHPYEAYVLVLDRYPAFRLLGNCLTIK